MGPPKMRFLDTYKGRNQKRFSQQHTIPKQQQQSPNRTNILYYGSFHYGNWQEAPKRLKMERKKADLPMTSATTVQ